MDIDYFHKCNRKQFLIIDSDVFEAGDYDAATVKTLNAKVEKNIQLGKEFENKGGKSFILTKRCIENYYHPRAIERLIKSESTPIPLDSFSATTDVPKYLSKYKEENNIHSNLKLKNNISIFQEMTPQEWQETSNGEIEEILDCIINT